MHSVDISYNLLHNEWPSLLWPDFPLFRDNILSNTESVL